MVSPANIVEVLRLLTTATSDDTLSTIFLIMMDRSGAHGGYVAFELWKKTWQEKEGDAHRLVQSGEGRTRFLAMCGVLTSVLFGLAVIFDVIGAMVGPAC